MERPRQSLLPEMPKKGDPVDVKAAKISRIVDLPQIGAGIGMIAFGFFPAIGAGLVAFNGVSYYVTGKYIERRTNGSNQNTRNTESRVVRTSLPNNGLY